MAYSEDYVCFRNGCATSEDLFWKLDALQSFIRNKLIYFLPNTFAAIDILEKVVFNLRMENTFPSKEVQSILFPLIFAS
jgi:hypothetical protein